MKNLDFNIDSTKPFSLVVVCENTFLDGDAYPVDRVRDGAAQSIDRMENILEPWEPSSRSTQRIDYPERARKE